MSDNIDEALAEVEDELAKARAEAARVKATLTPAKWNRRRQTLTKPIYNLLERKSALQWMRAFPDAVYWYDVKIVGFTGQAPFEWPPRTYDAVQIKNDFVQPAEMKSPGVVPASVKGGLSDEDILAEFRAKSPIGKQIRKERSLIRRATERGSKIILEGWDAVLNRPRRVEVDPRNLEISRVVRYGELPDKHLLTPDPDNPAWHSPATASRALDVAESDRGIAEKLLTAEHPDAARGVQPTKRRWAQKVRTPVSAAVKTGGRYALAIGKGSWRAFRTVGKFAFVCLVPLTVFDVLFELAVFLLGYEEQRKAEQLEEQQRWLGPILKQADEIQRQTEAKILGNHDVLERYFERWDERGSGFLYARITAELDVDISALVVSWADVADACRSVTITDVSATHSTFDFKLTRLGPDTPAVQTPSGLVRPTVRVEHTLVPPLLTPYDVLVTKMNNLFLDLVYFIAQFSQSGDAMLGQVSEKGFDYKRPYQEQFPLMLQFPHPLDEAKCKACLDSIYSAAGRLSRHALTVVDLEGNLENPERGWKRRTLILFDILEGKFPWRSLRQLVRPGKSNAEADAAMEVLCEGALAIWRDMRRVHKRSTGREYRYLGPT